MKNPWIQRETDVLIIGTGLAGLRAAIEARRFGQKVLLIDKALIGVNNNTALAGGGFKAALPNLDTSVEKQYDTPDEHFRDTVEYGEYLADQTLVEIMALEAPGRILELQEFNIPHYEALCAYGLPKPIELADGSTKVDANPSRGGQVVTLGLAEECKRLGVHMMPGCVLVDLLTGEDGVAGALLYRIYRGDFIVCRAASTIVATGGAGELYRINYTANVTTGDGYAAAYRAGAELVDMSFAMFSPHTMMEPGLPMWYLLPCTARLHAVYRNGKGEAFLDNALTPTGEPTTHFQKRYGELSTDVREIISRAIAIEIFEGRGDGDSIWLDLRDVPDELWESDLPGRYDLRCLLRGFDWKNRTLRISPGAITHLGGIGIKPWCETNLPGLYAAGESAAPVHGARRRGGNAFSDCLVFGARAGRAAAERARDNPLLVSDADWDREAVKERLADIRAWDRPPSEEGDPAAIRSELQRTMWENAGPLRSGERLETSLEDLQAIKRDRLPNLHARTPFEVKAALEAETLVEVGEMVVRSACFRTESRGCHFRTDYPNTDQENWICHDVILRGQEPFKREVDVTRVSLPVPVRSAHAD